MELVWIPRVNACDSRSKRGPGRKEHRNTPPLAMASTELKLIAILNAPQHVQSLVGSTESDLSPPLAHSTAALRFVRRQIVLCRGRTHQ